MSDLSLIEAVKTDDLAAIEQLIQSNADVNQQDEHGWTPMNWAAGRGNTAVITALLEKGADVFKVGTDQRTPYMIALAAGHADAARLLRDAEDRSGAGRTSRREKKYCKAYLLSSLRKFPAWSESRINWQEKKDDNGEAAFTDETIVFIHQDFTVTESMWQNENVIFDQVTDEWKLFCADELNFKVPDDFDLIVAPQTVGAAVAD